MSNRSTFLFLGRQSLSAFGQAYSLTSFGLSDGSFERLGNVYGFEGLDSRFRPFNNDTIRKI